MSSEQPAPLLIGGDLAVAFTDRTIVHELMAHLATPESGAAWAASDSYFAARTNPSGDQLKDPLASLQAELIANAEVLVFDGSDQMDPDFGAGLFWSEITRWVSGDISYDEMARHLDAARQE